MIGDTNSSGASGRVSAAALTADRLRREILEGVYAVGDLLPPERQLSETLGVSRLTLRSAIARLETEGLVRPQQGAGTRVLDYHESAGLELLGQLLGVWLSAGPGAAMPAGTLPVSLLRDLMELRRMLAVEVLTLAAERGSPEELQALREHVAAQRELVGDARAYMEADLALARKLVRAGKNLALELLTNSLGRALASAPLLAPAFLVNAEGTLAAYGELLDLVEGGDSARVRDKARTLLERLDADTVERVRALMEELGAPTEGG